MKSDSRKRASDLYHRALQQPPEDRRRFVRDACDGDDALRAEVESLLRFEASAADFLERPTAARPSAMLALTPASAAMLNRHLGPYHLLAPLGAGGMGEVYRARDTKLRREVAIKILPAHLTADPERRARFTREARLLATLNHPHIGAIYGLEDADGATALVLELVEGPTLADRLQRGPLPVPQALAIAQQIADALDAAHEKGIVHRDLKPANIVLHGTDGSGEVRAKVLDFGLAKLMPEGLHDVPREHDSDSLSGTEQGRILGTPAYMSPEQARGLAVDKRTDIWAFGCVLFEMLTGRPAFRGDTTTDTLARVLDAEPDWTALPDETPPALRTVLRRCLQKDPRRRLRDVADARMELDDVDLFGPPAVERAPVRPGSGGRTRIAWLAAAISAVVALAMTMLYIRAEPTPASPFEFPIVPPQKWFLAAGMRAPSFELSPDGQHVVIVAESRGVSSLWIRPISAPAWRQLAGTEGAWNPFWSPDSQSVAFFADGQLKTVRIAGGTPILVADAALGVPSGAWNRDNVMLFGGNSALYRVASRGGTMVAATTLATGERAHRWPSFLPDGHHFLFVAESESAAELRIGSLSSRETISLGPTASHAVFASGHLLFVRDGRLVAQPFDPRAYQPRGDPLILAGQTAIVAPWYRGQFSVSATGGVVYSDVGNPLSRLTWMDRDGTPLGQAGDPGVYINLDLTLDDRRVAVSRFWEPPGQPWNVDIWLIDLDRAGAATRLTVDPAREFDPVWSPDGETVAFNSSRIGERFSLFVRRTSGAGDDELLVESQTRITAPHWSPPDGDLIIYTEDGDGTFEDLWTVPVSGERTPTVFLRTPFRERAGVFSPNGRWVAYESDETGRFEVYVHPFPDGEGKYAISRDGGRAARWRGDGRELFFLAPDGAMMAAGIDASRGFRAGVPQRLFGTGLLSVETNHPYAVAGDGQRFLIPVMLDAPELAPITAVLNWPARLHR
jgi:eukaryotic-like serine/threonine-protein kinase